MPSILVATSQARALSTKVCWPARASLSRRPPCPAAMRRWGRCTRRTRTSATPCSAAPKSCRPGRINPKREPYWDRRFLRIHVIASAVKILWSCAEMHVIEHSQFKANFCGFLCVFTNFVIFVWNADEINNFAIFLCVHPERTAADRLPYVLCAALFQVISFGRGGSVWIPVVSFVKIFTNCWPTIAFCLRLRAQQLKVNKIPALVGVNKSAIARNDVNFGYAKSGSVALVPNLNRQRI